MPPVPSTSKHRARLPDVVRAWTWLLLLSLLALVLYVGQFEETNAYIGIAPIRELGDASYWLILAAWLGVSATLFPVRVRCPSDIFLALYLIGTGLWSAAYWPATGLIDQPQATLLAALLLLPAVLVKATQLLVRSVPLRLPVMPFALPRAQLTLALGAVLLVAMLLGYRAAGADGGFDFDEAFLRRLAGRDSFAGHALAAYLFQMSMNALAPLTAYVGALRRSWAAIGLALAFAVFGFWLVASKAPLLNVLVLAALGHLVRTGKVVHFARWLTLALGVVMVLSVLELWAFDLSLIAEFAVRRMILVSSTIQVYFFDALTRVGLLPLLSGGLPTAGFATPEYFIGANYMGNEATNANTNAYLHQLAAGGLLSFLAVTVGTALFTGALDLRFVRGRHDDGFALAALLGVLLIEQAFTTALVSSGVLLALLFCLVFSRDAPLRIARVPRHFSGQIS